MEQLNLSNQDNTKSTAKAMRPTASTIVTPPEIADKYTLIRELGHGAQGYVYEAIRRSNNLKVAIKQLRIDSVQTWKSYDLFQRESEVLASLNVEGVAKLYESMTFLDIPHPAAYIVQEFIDGRSIDTMLKAGARLSHTRILEIGVKLIELLQNLHTHNPPVVHRDIKPSNVMLSAKSDGSFDLYLIDFGAVANPQLQSGGSTVAGTYGYMAPEQLMGKPSPASDIYALAAMLASLLSGVEPADMQIADFRLVIEPHLQMLPNCVVATLRQMLAPNAANRLVDYKILKERFELYASNRFEAADSDSIQSSDLSVELAKVKSFGQPGNIELWCLLPENTPRDIESFEHLFQPTSIIDEYDSIITKLAKSNKLLNLNIILIFSFGLLLLFSYFFVKFDYDVPPALCTTIIIGAILGLSLWGISSTQSISTEFQYGAGYSPASNAKSFKKQKNITFNVIRDLLMNGQKAIATIVSVEYQPLNTGLIETYQKTVIPRKNLAIKQNGSSDRYRHSYSTTSLDDSGMSIKRSASETVITMDAITKDFFYFHGLPSYKIRYKFNPVDDSNPDDLFHEIIVHHNPANSLKPGDVLPILYKVDPNDSSKVSSMPFPLPAINISSCREIVADNETQY